ncbi:MAG: bifunctional enoyl-CoA hydratase/phosphate acetyltransferase [Pseudomonadota bacterium]
MIILKSRTYDSLQIGERASLERTLTQQDILLFAGVSGDVNPAHLDHQFAAGSVFEQVIGHGMWTGALVSALIGTKLPGPGSIYISQSFKFRAPVKVGDTLTIEVRVNRKLEGRRVALDCSVAKPNGETVLSGEAIVLAPDKIIEVEAQEHPSIVLAERGERLLALIKKAANGRPIRTAIVHPVDAISLRGALAAQADRTITPVLIGPSAKIAAAAAVVEIPLDGIEIIDVPHSHAAGEEAARRAASGDCAAIMKGALHTDEVLEPILDKSAGLRTERRLSHVFVMDAPSYHKLLFITDAAVNIAPTLEQKADILRNAALLAASLGVSDPKAAILTAVETVTQTMPSTVDAAALCKMVDRGQIKGVRADGPLAFDNAISSDAAKTKGLTSDVAGDADILLVPDIEAGNIMAKQLDYLAGAVAGGIVLGARVPIILTSRAEGVLPRRASCAIANLFDRSGEPS